MPSYYTYGIRARTVLFGRTSRSDGWWCSLQIDEDALRLLGEIGSRTSLRYPP